MFFPSNVEFKKQKEKVYYFSLKNTSLWRKINNIYFTNISRIFHLGDEIFNTVFGMFHEYSIAWIQKIQFIKKKVHFFWVEKNHKSCLGGGGVGTNKTFEIHLSNPWKRLFGSSISSKTQISVGLI